MTTPCSISDTYQVLGDYLKVPGIDNYVCITSLERYFHIPPRGTYVHFRFYATAQPGTVRVELTDRPRTIRVGEAGGGGATLHQLLEDAYYTLRDQFTIAKTQALYVELYEGPHDMDCNTLPESVQYPHIGEPVKI